tara:strand:+ start:90 stop:269 length:180 start_codon:yes stop_codon:yes gene_type:complete
VVINSARKTLKNWEYILLTKRKRKRKKVKRENAPSRVAALAQLSPYSLRAATGVVFADI